MKKRILGSALLLVAGLVLVFQEPLRDAFDDWKTRDMFVPAVAADPGLGPATGQRLPPLQASLRGGTVTDIGDFARGNGAVLVVLRSIDWCAYCKRQIIQLQAYQHNFHAAGIGLVAITYDTPQAQQPFIEQHGITIPVLSDVGQGSFRALGVLNERHQPGDSEYGIPHPGMIILDRSGAIVGKLFVPSHEFRVDSSEALRYARAALGLKAPLG